MFFLSLVFCLLWCRFYCTELLEPLYLCYINEVDWLDWWRIYSIYQSIKNNPQLQNMLPVTSVVAKEIPHENASFHRLKVAWAKWRKLQPSVSGIVRHLLRSQQLCCQQDQVVYVPVRIRLRCRNTPARCWFKVQPADNRQPQTYEQHSHFPGGAVVPTAMVASRGPVDPRRSPLRNPGQKKRINEWPTNAPTLTEDMTDVEAAANVHVCSCQVLHSGFQSTTFFIFHLDSSVFHQFTNQVSGSAGVERLRPTLSVVYWLIYCSLSWWRWPEMTKVLMKRKFKCVNTIAIYSGHCDVTSCSQAASSFSPFVAACCSKI